MSRFVQDNFAAAWQSMRPVPRLTIDFGDGRKLERTLRGNIATYLCTSDGHVIDVVPGLCDPATFLARLREAVRIAALPPDHAEQHTRWLHQAKLAEVRRATVSEPPPLPAGSTSIAPSRKPVDRSKVALELPSVGAGRALPLAQTRPLDLRDLAKGIVEFRDVGTPPAIAAGGRGVGADGRFDNTKHVAESSMFGPGDLVVDVNADRKLLLADSATNRAERDPLVHEMLSRGWWMPRDVEKNVYAEILHCDLDDPWLGLAEGPFGGGAYEGFDRVEPATTPR